MYRTAPYPHTATMILTSIIISDFCLRSLHRNHVTTRTSSWLVNGVRNICQSSDFSTRNHALCTSNAQNAQLAKRIVDLLLLSFMKVHRSLSSVLWAKEQFPMYWHFLPAATWIQICRHAGIINYSRDSDSINNIHFCSYWKQGPFFFAWNKHITLTSNWAGMGFLVGRVRTVVHFFRSIELTRTTRLSLDQLVHRKWHDEMLSEYWT